ncbi:MAG: hypothetical protein V4726_22645 [Verrucomicrobiota bacterium]
MKRNPSAKILRLALSALGGLACGLMVRHFRASETAAPSPPIISKPAAGLKPAAVPDEWERVLAGYLKLPSPAAATSESGSRRESDAFLRMLLQPAGRDTIREGIAFLNGMDTLRYWVVLPSLFAHWAAENPDAAREEAAELRDPMARDTLIWEAFHALGTTNPAEALAKARDLPAPALRSAALHAVAASLKPDQMPEILRESMKGAGPPQLLRGASFQKDVFRAWAESDLPAPVKFAAGIDDPAWRREMLETALLVQSEVRRLKTSKDAKPDTATLLELAKDPRNVPGITDQIGTLIGSGQPGAAAILAAMPAATDREEVMTGTMGDIFALLGRDDISESITKSANEGLEALARETSAQGQSGEFSKALLAAATRGDVPALTAAARWMATHDPAHLDELTARAAAKIPFSAAKWLSALPASPERDRAVAIFAETHAATDPERATAWAESITDPAKRATALAAVGGLAAASCGPQ